MTTVFSKRIIAYVLDFFIVSAVMWMLAFLLSLIVSPLDVVAYYAYFPYIAAVFGFAYFAFLEKTRGSTIGKALMGIEVKSRNGANINWAQSFVRNLTKVFWVPIIFDWLIGRFLNTDRLFANITRTVVVNMY